MTPASSRPRIICHMLVSIDGRIVTKGWLLSDEAHRQHELVHASYHANAWICGRTTMEPFAKHLRSDADVACEYAGAPREDFHAPGVHESFAFALDTHGRLAWESNDISGDHVVAILTARVSDEYLDFLRSRGVSYLIAGDEEIDLAFAMQKIATQFAVPTLLLEGGGAINGAFVRAGLIDEVSLLVAPVADGRVGLASLFDADSSTVAHRLTLLATEQREGEVIWLRYKVANKQS